jgi:hypothetical protein
MVPHAKTKSAYIYIYSIVYPDFFSRFSEVGSLIPDLLDMVKHFFFFFIIKLHFVRTHADITDNDGFFPFPFFFFFYILFGRRKSINSFVISSPRV